MQAQAEAKVCTIRQIRRPLNNSSGSCLLWPLKQREQIIRAMFPHKSKWWEAPFWVSADDFRSTAMNRHSHCLRHASKCHKRNSRQPSGALSSTSLTPALRRAIVRNDPLRRKTETLLDEEGRS